MHGLSNETYNKIKQVITKYSQYNFKLFGSRAKGTYKYNSDIDLAIMDKIEEEIAEKIKMELNDLNIIYKIDFVVVENCSNEELIQNIINEGVDF